MPKNKRTAFFIFTILTLVVTCLYSDKKPSGDVKGASEKQESKAEVIFLDVGQGDAILIQEGWTQILIDGGDGQEIMNRLGEFMPLGDRKIEFMAVTHPDEDHMGGLIKVLSFYEIGEILESGIACDKDICDKWKALIETENIPIVNAKMGQEIKVGEDVNLSVLYPFEEVAGEEFKNSNEASLVLKMVVEGKKYLVTGDTEGATEKKLISSNLDLDADVLKVSHHGSKSATSADFLMAVSPKEAVISVGKNSYGHPTEEVLNRLSNMNIEILRTDQAGSVRF